ncbi:hypothetical protein E4U21_006854 [Claviceps maximensis]|nr:hypothetical protein E4U21_006854 [Claviceps maximensis]
MQHHPPFFKYGSMFSTFKHANANFVAHSGNPQYLPVQLRSVRRSTVLDPHISQRSQHRDDHGAYPQHGTLYARGMPAINHFLEVFLYVCAGERDVGDWNSQKWADLLPAQAVF